MISLDVSLEEMPGDRKVIYTGRQEAGTCQGWLVPALRFVLGLSGPALLLTPVLVFWRDSPPVDVGAQRKQ